MGFFDFLKKIKQGKEEDKIINEKIRFNEIQENLEKKLNEKESSDKEVLKLIISRKDNFLKELELKKEILKKVDVESKKAEDRIKSIVKTGLSSYLPFLEELTNKLSSIKKEKSIDFLEEINNAIFKFDKNSNSSYQRANILIGKEIVDIKEEIRIFSKEVLEIFNENKKNITPSREIHKIKDNLNDISEIKDKMIKIKKDIDQVEKSINKEKESKEKISKEIKHLKNSEDYLINIKAKEELLKKERELEEDILKLRSLIDFKYLTNLFHTNEKKMNIIKEYRDNFKTSFLRSFGEDLIKILEESTLNKESILSKINEIKDKLNKINKDKERLNPDKTKELSNEINSILLKINELEKEKNAKENIYKEKIKEKEEIKKTIINQLKSLNIEVID